MKETPYYPVILDLRFCLVLVVGGGKVAERKILSLLKSGASVRVVAKELTPALLRCVDRSEISWIGRDYSDDHLTHVFMVIAATDDAELNHRISRDAKARNLLINAVDQPGDCNFIVPSIVRRGDLILAISTSGKSPAFAKKLRKELEKEFGNEYDSFIKLMGEIRKRVLDKDLSQEDNKLIFNRLIHSDILQAIQENDLARIAVSLEEILDETFSEQDIKSFLIAE